MMRIAVLDDYHNLGAEYLSPLLASAPADSTVELTVFRDTLPQGTASERAALAARLAPFDVICSMRERTPFPVELLALLPRLRVLLTTGTRNAAIDVAAAARRGVVVAGTPPSEFRNWGTVQHTWALILALADNIPRDDALVRAGAWSSGLPLNSLLAGRTLGVLGLGQLGGEVARLGAAFGMRVVAWSPNLTQERADAVAVAHGLVAGSFAAVSRDQLFASADVLSVHLVLSARTRGLVTAADLAQMKPTALLVNTARGPLIDEAALLDALARGAIAGAALDVFDTEPLSPDSPWRTTPWGTGGRARVVLTPHTGYAFDDMLGFMWERTAENVARVVRGDEPLWRLDAKFLGPKL